MLQYYFLLKGNTMNYKTVSLLLLCAFAFASMGISVARAVNDPVLKSAPRSGVYCMKTQDELRVFAERINRDKSMTFGISLWYPNGGNFSVYGKAKPQNSGWRHEENLKSSNPDDRCAVDISLTKDGDYFLKVDPKAPCTSMAGHEVRTESVLIPKHAYESPVKTELHDAEAFQSAGKCGATTPTAPN
jgi:hypothetical protein